FFYDVEDDPYGREDDGNGGLFATLEEEVDLEELAKGLLPDFSLSNRMRRSVDMGKSGFGKKGGQMSEAGAKSGKNIGGGKTYQKNEFRSIHNNRKANTSRPPSVHVDDFTKGGGPASAGPSSADASKKPGLGNRRSIDIGASGQPLTSARGARAGTTAGTRKVGGAGRSNMVMPRPPMDGMGAWAYGKPMDFPAAAAAWNAEAAAAAAAVSGIPLQLMGPPMPKYPSDFDRRAMDDRPEYPGPPPPRYDTLGMRPYFDGPPGFYPTMGPPPPMGGPYDHQMQQRGSRGDIVAGSGGPLSPKWPQGPPPPQRIPGGMPGMPAGMRAMGGPNDRSSSSFRRRQ
ncbi:hypothetical protein BC938DRAFT_480929, partial [Jimgerdemannia flammicorona]